MIMLFMLRIFPKILPGKKCILFGILPYEKYLLFLSADR